MEVRVLFFVSWLKLSGRSRSLLGGGTPDGRLELFIVKVREFGDLVIGMQTTNTEDSK